MGRINTRVKIYLKKKKIDSSIKYIIYSSKSVSVTTSPLAANLKEPHYIRYLKVTKMLSNSSEQVKLISGNISRI